MKKASNNGGLWWERGLPHPSSTHKKLGMSPEQKKISHGRANARYRKRLKDKWRTSYNKAQILERQSKEEENGRQ